jgi:DMSO/TMAO reductase YedYZ molybdopterin-dependent catalytic subunit
MQPGSLLAYDMNGALLNGTHGAPLRLVVPGIYGMKNVKWITKLEVVAIDYKGYWQRRGWDDRAEYQTMSRIDVARASRAGEPATIAGIAFAGDRGIARVEVSTDGGATWRDAELRAPLSPNAWVLWRLEWTPPAAGTFTVVVRATDGRGDVQTKREAPPIPSGSTGWHSVALTVRGAV